MRASALGLLKVRCVEEQRQFRQTLSVTTVIPPLGPTSSHTCLSRRIRSMRFDHRHPSLLQVVEKAASFMPHHSATRRFSGDGSGTFRIWRLHCYFASPRLIFACPSLRVATFTSSCVRFTKMNVLSPAAPHPTTEPSWHPRGPSSLLPER